MPLIIDTSALIALLLGESGADAIEEALHADKAMLPAPARIEFIRVGGGSRLRRREHAHALLSHLEQIGLQTIPFTPAHALIACEANETFGKGNGRGGLLNLLDLMVYAVAKERDEPLLCTGRDFASTDLLLHPASRAW